MGADRQRPPIAARPAGAADTPAIVELLAGAFFPDPAMRHILPDDRTRPERLRRFFAMTRRIEPLPGLTDVALDETGAPVAAALWRPPGAWQNGPGTILANLPALLRIFGTRVGVALRVNAALEAHHPKPPHWYLQIAGCHPAKQGRGYGGAAIRARLARLDAEGLPAALETATESNLALYRSLGFEVTDTFEAVPGLTFWEMWRAPR